VTAAHLRAAPGAARDVAIQAHEKIREIVSDKLRSTKMEYLDSLSYGEDGGLYTITLGGEAAYLETGYGSFDMKPGMLNSKAIVQTGKRAGQPWVQIGKDGNKYAAVPFEHGEAAAKSSHPEHDSPVRIGQPEQTTKGDLASDLKALREAFGDEGITMGPGGQPVQGKVATWTKSKSGPQWSFKDVLGNSSTKSMEANPMLSGLTKIQYEVPKRKGGNMTKSAFLTWRIVSSKSNKWIHPGYGGVHAFPEVHAWASDALVRRVTELFQQGI
jgi:hypothetical protein